MMMQARPRTAGTAARRKQRALASARARSDSRQEVGRPQSRAHSAMGARPRSASVVANGTTGNGNGHTGGSGGDVGPSMVIPKVLFILFMVCLIIGGIMVAITTLEDAQLGSTKLVGVFIIVGGGLFLIAAIVVCICKKARWAADQADDDVGVTTSSRAPTSTSGSERRARYAANHVEDETSRPPTRAWNMDGTRPTSAYSTGTTRDIEMTLTSERQNDLFSISGSGAGNGGFLADDQLTFRTTPQIKITCEEDEVENGGNVTTAADIEGSNSEDVKIVMGDENLVGIARPAGIPVLDLSGVLPSPSVNRKSFENEGFSFDLDDETPPVGSAPSTASFGTNSGVNSPSRTQLNQSNDSSDWSIVRSRPKSPLSGVNEGIELKVIKADVTDNLDLIEPETTFKGSELTTSDVTGSNEEVGVSGNVSSSSESDDKRAKEDDSVPFDLGLLVGGRGRVE